MRVRRLMIRNFRGIADGTVDFAGDTLLVGGNNIGKSTICEALDLVLGPERIFRRPVVDEHDFHGGRLLDEDGTPIEIGIRAILLDLSEEARLRFHRHLRRWNDITGAFADEGQEGPAAGDAEGAQWALPVLFLGRYDRDEDDFIGGTFFDHPVEPIEDEEDASKLGAGRKPFTRDQKRLCGFVLLRMLRTGSRALSLQRGSLLDTVLRIHGGGMAEMWKDTLLRLQELEPPIGDIDQLKQIRDEIHKRMSRFVQLAAGDDATAFFASELTREHLREVVRLFVAAQPGTDLVPFQRLGAGSLNLLVFALLTFIADLKEKGSAIFAMEEPEIALPPHTQRRVTRFALSEMGQCIVTSHSPYVIEEFKPENIVIVDRTPEGRLSGRPVTLPGLRPKKYKTERRQFAEALLARAVLVVEGATEASLFPVASTVMEEGLGGAYTHFDLAGVSVFDAGGDGSVPKFGPVFAALGKAAFGFYDTPNDPLDADAQAKLATYARHWMSPEKGIENLLARQTALSVLKRFLDVVKNRTDYPQRAGTISPRMTEEEVRALAQRVLAERKGGGYGYAAMLVEQCRSPDELPEILCTILTMINAKLTPPAQAVEVPAAATAQAGGTGRVVD